MLCRPLAEAVNGSGHFLFVEVLGRPEGNYVAEGLVVFLDHIEFRIDHPLVDFLLHILQRFPDIHSHDTEKTMQVVVLC